MKFRSCNRLRKLLAGVSISHFAGRSLPLKYYNFQQIYKKLSQLYKKFNFDKISAKSMLYRMFVGLHTHYQMYLASKFTLKVPKNTSKYPKVPKNTQKYLKVTQITQKYLKIPQSIKKYLKVSKSTSKYPKVPQITSK